LKLLRHEYLLDCFARPVVKLADLLWITPVPSRACEPPLTIASITSLGLSATSRGSWAS